MPYERPTICSLSCSRAHIGPYRKCVPSHIIFIASLQSTKQLSLVLRANSVRVSNDTNGYSKGSSTSASSSSSTSDGGGAAAAAAQGVSAELSAEFEAMWATAHALGVPLLARVSSSGNSCTTITTNTTTVSRDTSTESQNLTVFKTLRLFLFLQGLRRARRVPSNLRVIYGQTGTAFDAHGWSASSRRQWHAGEMCIYV